MGLLTLVTCTPAGGARPSPPRAIYSRVSSRDRGRISSANSRRAASSTFVRAVKYATSCFSTPVSRLVGPLRRLQRPTQRLFLYLDFLELPAQVVRFASAWASWITVRD